MDALSDAMTLMVIDHITGAANAAPLAGRFLGLATAAPAASGTPLNEVTGGGYQRFDITGAFGAASGAPGDATNISTILFEDMPAVTVSHAFIITALTGGILVYTFELMDDLLTTPTPIDVPLGVDLAFSPGTLVIQGTNT